MATMLKPRKHKVKKKETIQTIAKTYGFKDWKEVWKHPGNDKMRKTHKDGAGLQPGEFVTVPALNEKERDERREKTRQLGFQIGNGKYLADQLLEVAKQYDAEAARLDKRAKDIGAGYDALTKEVGNAASSIKKKALGADITAKVVTMVVAGNSFRNEAGKKDVGLKKLALEKLGKLNNPTVKKIAAGGGSVLGLDGGKNLLEAMGVLEKDHVDEVEILAKELGRLYYNITAPSFYGQAALTLYKGGTWSEAMTADIQRDLKTSATQIAKNKKAAIAMIDAAAARTRKRAAKARADSASLLKGVEKLRKEKDAL